MPSRSIRGCLNFIGTMWRDLLFRTIVLATLVNVGLVFAIHTPDNEAGHETGQTSQGDRIRPSVTSEKTPEERTADYTYWLTAETLALAISTVGLWVVTWRGMSSQSRDVRELFVADQRPWLKVKLLAHGQANFEKGHASIPMTVIIQNVGKTPANDVTIGRAEFYSEIETIKWGFENARNSVEHCGIGFSLVPTEKALIDIQALVPDTAILDRNRINLDDAVIFCVVKYVSALTNEVYETSFINLMDAERPSGLKPETIKLKRMRLFDVAT